MGTVGSPESDLGQRLADEARAETLCDQGAAILRTRQGCYHGCEASDLADLPDGGVRCDSCGATWAPDDLIDLARRALEAERERDEEGA